MSDERPLIGINLLYIRPGYIGGTVRYAYELLRHLVSSGRYRWILYVQAGAFSVDDPELTRVRRKEFHVRGGLIGRVLIEHTVLPVVAHRDGVDLLFSPGFVSPLWGDFRKVVTVHDLYYRRFPEFVRFWQRSYWRLFLPASLAAVDAVIADSDSTKVDLDSAFPWVTRKVRRIHLGADALNSADGEVQDDEPFCLVIGNITPNKNIEATVEAFSQLKAKNISCRLLVAGNDLFGLMEQALKRVHPRPTVELLKHVTDATLAQLFARSTCLIQASYHEGFGLPVVEAMAVGCPVVASDIPVMHEIGGDAAIYFPVYSSDALAAAITRLLNEDGLRGRLAAAGKKNASRFRWSYTAEETAKVFAEVLHSRL